MPKIPGSLGAQGKDLVENQAHLERLLKSPAAKQVAQLLRRQDGAALQAAAQAALQGDSTALQGVLQSLQRDPDAARAMDQLEKDWK
jgi:hypothetical protein